MKLVLSEKPMTDKKAERTMEVDRRNVVDLPESDIHRQTLISVL